MFIEAYSLILVYEMAMDHGSGRTVGPLLRLKLKLASAKAQLIWDRNITLGSCI